MAVKNKVQLITYPDSLGGDLKSLKKVLETDFAGLFEGGIHILPPYPSSGDRGFAPLTYLEIDPAFGNWEDIEAIASSHDLLLDLMVNHLSKDSEYFRDFLKNGRNSEYADLFITLDKFWKDGIPNTDDTNKMFLRRKEPFSTFRVGDTKEEIRVWTTFGRQDPSEQIDIDVRSERAKQLLTQFLINFSKHNVKTVRLDAIGYVSKKPGTSCFFTEPLISEFIDWISHQANLLNIELLPEVHSHYSIQQKLSEKGHWIYDFILPYFILETLINKSSGRLKSYLQSRPHKQFTMLDCHDGIPVKPDLDDLVSSDDAQKTVEVCVERGANLSLIFSDKHKSKDGFDVHQIRGTIYSLLNSDDDAYLAARAIQFFTPGIPQVYYVGMLAGENDSENVLKTGEGREINRHNYSPDEINAAMQKNVVKRLVSLIKFRNNYQAFGGIFSIADTADNSIGLQWEKDSYSCKLSIDLTTMKGKITYIADDKSTRETEI